jgi:hypothetical protein
VEPYFEEQRRQSTTPDRDIPDGHIGREQRRPESVYGPGPAKLGCTPNIRWRGSDVSLGEVHDFQQRVIKFLTQYRIEKRVVIKAHRIMA